MKSTINNGLKVFGALFLCTLIATNYGAVSSLVSLLGSIAKGTGNIMLIVLGQSDKVGGGFRANTGDDGSGDSGFAPLKPYRD